MADLIVDIKIEHRWPLRLALRLGYVGVLMVSILPTSWFLRVDVK